MKNNNIIIFVIFMALSLLAYNFYANYFSGVQNENQITYSKFLDDIRGSNISKVSVNGNVIKAINNDSSVSLVTVPSNDNEWLGLLKERNVDIEIVNLNASDSGISLWIILLVLGLIIFFVMRRAKEGGSDIGRGGGLGGAFGFGKSKAKLISPDDGDSLVIFDDVAGVDEAKEELQEVVEFLKDTEKFKKLGAKIPKGCLLVGPPGSGKTLLARAIAGEAKVDFFSISGSDFVEMFVGVGASRVRDLFDQAKKHTPCIIFIDEIDAVGRQRGVGIGGGNDEREQTLNQLLVELDGFKANQGVIVIAATNRPDVLDQALLRPGRFDRQVVVPLPDLVGRERILRIYLSKVPIDESVEAAIIARNTTGFSGADLANLVNEAAILAARRNTNVVSVQDFEEARDKIMLGSERRSAKMTDEDRILTAYHEAGHALVAFNVSDFYPVHKVTIIPRGRSLGSTSFLPEKDEYNKSYAQLTAQLAVLFGGRVAEELIFGIDKVTTGASMDIQMASNIARKMVTEWGYSDKVGRIRYNDSESSYTVIPSSSQIVSSQTTRDIEEEIKRFIDMAQDKAREILTSQKKGHKKLAESLLEYETLSGEEAKRVCAGESVEQIRKKTSNTDSKHNTDSNILEDSSIPDVG